MTGPAHQVEFAKRDAWRDDAAARRYEARRFGGWLGRRKQALDERAVVAALRRAGAHDGARVLDLPCGTGRLLAALRAARFEVVGADVAREMLRAGGPHDTPLVQADVASLPFRANVFDAVLSMRFLFHVERPAARIAMLREMARVGSGCVVVQVRHRATLKHGLRWLRGSVGATRRYRAAQGAHEMAAEFAEAGLELVELAPLSRLFSDKVLAIARAR